jgi:16S rRNA G966 N2-methylase RsmD
MNRNILNEEVQQYIDKHINDDVNQIALAKPVFENISSAELAGQIAAKKKAKNKLNKWFSNPKIYYSALLSIEQCSSEPTANYKSGLAKGNSLIDLTSGFGVDSFFFAKKVKTVYSCEINEDLAAISAHNAKQLGATNIQVLAVDGLAFLKNTKQHFGTIYIDPARRNQSNKVFKLKDCSPDVTKHLELFLSKADRIIIKTAPLLDITAGLTELKNVREIHIVSVKNECKELLWVIDKDFVESTTVVCATLNESLKTFEFELDNLKIASAIAEIEPKGYLYEPDVALLKSGAFNLIADRFNLQKLHQQTQLYFSEDINTEFLGRIFEIEKLFTLNELKKKKNLSGNVIVRNFPEKAENLAKKYKIIPTHDDFIIFTQTVNGYIAIKAKIIQHY